MCRHSAIQHACKHTTRSQESCEQTPSIFGMIFCDDFQVSVQSEPDTFCSRDGLYCSEAFEGQCIEAIRIQVANLKSELLGIRDNLDNANNYATSRADQPGQLSLQQSQLQMTPLSLKTHSNRRELLMGECRAFASRAQYLRAVLAQRGLARPMTPDIGPIAQQALESFALRRSDRLTARSSSRVYTDPDASPLDYEDSPKPKRRRQSAANRRGGSTRRRRGTGSLHGQTSLADPFVERQRYGQVDPRKILMSHRSF